MHGRTMAALAMVAATIVISSCSAGGSDAASTTKPPKASTSTTTTEAATSTTVALEPVPWSEVLEAGKARTGRLTRVVDAADDETGDLVSASQASQLVTFDRDRGLLQGGVSVIGEDGLTALSFDFVYSPEGMFFTTDGVEEACGAAWVEVDPATVAEAGLDIVDVQDLGQLGPFEALAAVDPPSPTGTTADGSTYEVALPASNGIAVSYFDDHPGAEEALAKQTTPAVVEISPELDIRVEQRLPFSTLAAAGGDDAGPAGEGASMRSVWRLESVGEPVTIEVPTDVAADPSCADDI